jgi:hypothetical protein
VTVAPCAFVVGEVVSSTLEVVVSMSVDMDDADALLAPAVTRPVVTRESLEAAV